MSVESLTLMTKLEDLDAYSHTVLKQFPKLERHLLIADIKRSMAAIIRLAIIAWKRKQKSAALFDADVEVEVLRSLIRKSHKLGHINIRRLDIWMRHTNEIGRIVGGWIKQEAYKK